MALIKGLTSTYLLLYIFSRFRKQRKRNCQRTKDTESVTISENKVDSNFWRVPFKVEANRSKGFSLPYILNVPYTVQSKSIVFVEALSTSTHTDDMAIHLKSGFYTSYNRMFFVQDLKTPLLILIIPHPADNHDDFQGLGRGSLVSNRENLVRVDLQLIAMIEDARDRLKQLGILAKDKVFMDGFSHSGQFTNRFTILHPDKVQAAAIGAPGGWPIAPLSEWLGYTMNYPVGIADIQQLIGEQFDAALYKTVPQFLFMGADDTNDAIGRFTTEEQAFLNSPGTTPYGRWPHAKEMYDTLPAILILSPIQV